MSQQGAGADDWWQKLYEDPDAVPETDPGDTLDTRFRSASVLTTAPPPGPAVPPPRPDPTPPPSGATPPPTPIGGPPGLPTRPQAGQNPAPPDPPVSAAPAGPVLDARGPEPAAPPPPFPTAGAASRGPAEGAHEAAAPPPPRKLVPGPRDPRAGGATGYALGDVAVPPAPPAWPGEAARPEVSHLGDRAPTYAAEPGALPAADPAALDALTPDTVLEGARYGTYTLRAASQRGDSARFRGETRRDFLLTARFGSGDDALLLVAVAGGDRAAPGAPAAAAELCRTIAATVGRSQERLADDIRAGRRDALRSGLQRLTDRGYGRLRARAAELGLAEEAYTAGLRALLLPVDPECRTRVCFGSGEGGLFRLRAGEWQDLEPYTPGPPTEGDFRFRAAVARPGDTLLVCSGGLADPMREEALLPAELAARWAQPEPPGLAAFLADTQLRLKGYADDRTAAAVWEA